MFDEGFLHPNHPHPCNLVYIESPLQPGQDCDFIKSELDNRALGIDNCGVTWVRERVPGTLKDVAATFVACV